MSSQHSLKIDPEFRNLIRPLYEREYQQLEKNLLSDGCREPITVWNGYIVDGHNRYEICSKYGIPFEIEEMDFPCKEAAIAWICANQLGRRNITDETRKFLIGMQYESEKKANAFRNSLGTNQYSALSSADESDISKPGSKMLLRERTADRIACENNISHGTVEKYAQYSKALKRIEKAEPRLVAKILAGKYKISHEKVIGLSTLSAKEIQGVNHRLERTSEDFAQYITTRNAIPRKSTHKQCSDGPSVKDMPAYDPDAEITGLTLTIPSWISSITRIQSASDLTVISVSARQKLQTALAELYHTVNEMINLITEDPNE